VSHWSDRIAVFDTETTGLSVREDRIVTAYLGVMGPSGEMESAWSWLADPGVIIPPRATAVHGVTTQMAQEQGRQASVVIGEIVQRLQEIHRDSTPLVVYNASYDLSLIHYEARRHGLGAMGPPRPVIDPLVIDRALDPYRKGKRTLDVVSAHYGVVNPAAHNAEGDALTAGMVARALVRRFPEDTSDVWKLHDQQVDWAYHWAENFRRYLERQGRPATGLSGAWPTSEEL